MKIIGERTQLHSKAPVLFADWLIRSAALVSDYIYMFLPAPWCHTSLRCMRDYLRHRKLKQMFSFNSHWPYWREFNRYYSIYSCGQKFTYIYHGHKCYGNIGLLRTYWKCSFSGEEIVQHISLIIIFFKNPVHKFSLFILVIYNQHRVQIIHTGAKIGKVQVNCVSWHWSDF